MLSTEIKRKEHETEEEPEEFFARYILTRAFESEQDSRAPTALRIGLINPNTAYELAHVKSADMDDDLFMVRVASYPSKGIEDWTKTALFSARHQADTYIHYLKSPRMQASRM